MERYRDAWRQMQEMIENNSVFSTEEMLKSVDRYRRLRRRTFVKYASMAAIVFLVVVGTIWFVEQRQRPVVAEVTRLPLQDDSAADHVQSVSEAPSLQTETVVDVSPSRESLPMANGRTAFVAVESKETMSDIDVADTSLVVEEFSFQLLLCNNECDTSKVRDYLYELVGTNMKGKTI